jgi:hypothetical protein
MMNLQSTRTTTIGTWKHLRTAGIAAACGLGLTAAAVGGVGLRQAAVRQAPHRAAGATAFSQPVSSASWVPPVYLLVSSQEEADRVEEALAYSDYAAGSQAVTVEQPVVVTPENEVAFYEGVRAMNLMADAYNQPAVRIVDLREPAAAASQSTEPPTVNTVPEAAVIPDPSTLFYTTGSIEQAAQVKDDLAMSAAYTGEPPVATVTVVSSLEEETTAYQAIREVAAKSPNVQVIDLRPFTYLLVSSPEEAAEVQAAVNGGDAQLVARLDVRVVTGSEQEAELRRAAAANANFIDLRPLEGIQEDSLP